MDAGVVLEGNSGTTAAMFDVEVLTIDSTPIPVTVDLTTVDGTATAADGDYVPQTAIQLFFPSDGLQTVVIDVQGDFKVEADETFQVMITNVSPGATIVPGMESGEATIQNDDQTSLSIDDVAVDEGDTGATVDAIFTVALSAPSDFAVTVDYATADGTATANSGDYQTAAGSLLFAPGVTSLPVVVQVNGDSQVEPDESFAVGLSQPGGATIADGSGAGTIRNDDLSSLSIDDVAVTEGNAGSVDAIFTVSLSQPSPAPVTVQFATADGTATTADGDYQATAGTLTFNPGQVSRPIAVTVNGDLTVEPDEGFVVDLSMPAGATLSDAQGAGTIGNDDGATLSIGDATVEEGDAGGRDAALPVRLSAASALPVSVGFVTRDGTATTADDDYRARVGRLTFPPGVTLLNVLVPVVGDTGVEADERLTVELREPDGAALGDAEGTLTIRNDDAAPGSIRLVGPPDVAEGEMVASVVAERSGGADGAASVDFATSDGTARAGRDYRATAGTLSWAPGESGSKSFELPILDDNLREDDETVTIRLTNPVGATLGVPARLDLVIVDDDQPTLLEAIGETGVGARVGGRLELRVRATREDGSPVEGAEVVWEVAGDAELLGEAANLTDADGNASQQVALGDAPGTVTVRARIAATEQVVTFEIAVADALDELFDPLTSPGESSLAAALSAGCRDAGEEFAELCDYLFGLDPDQQRELIGELTPREAGALADLLLQAPYAQLLNLRRHLAARRRGGSSSQIALGLTGETMPLDALRAALAGEVEVVRLMAARIDAAMFQRAEEEPPSAAPAEIDQPSRFNVFASGRVDVGDRPSSEREAGYDLETLGLTIGLDYQVSPRLVIGGALGYVDTDTAVAGDGGGIDVRGYSLSGFATYFRERLWLDGILSYNRTEYEFLRHIDLPQPFQGQRRLLARGQPEGSQVAIDLGAGYDTAFGATSLTGFGRLSYIDAEVDGFTEEGAGPFGLALGGQQIESLLLEAGLEVVRASSRRWGVLQPVLRASALHEFEDDSRVVVASFAADGGGNVFRLPTDRPDRDFFRLGLGLTATLARGRGLYLLYETDLARDDLDLYRVTAGLRLEL